MKKNQIHVSEENQYETNNNGDDGWGENVGNDGEEGSHKYVDGEEAPWVLDKNKEVPLNDNGKNMMQAKTQSPATNEKRNSENYQNLQPQSLYLYTSGADRRISQLSLRYDYTVSDWVDIGDVHSKPVTSVEITPDQAYLFTGDLGGHLVQIDIEERKIVKDFGRIHRSGIYTMVSTSDSKFMFVADGFGFFKKIDVAGHKVDNDYGKLHTRGCHSMALAKSGRSMFTSDLYGNLKLWNVQTEFILHDFSQIHNGSIYSIL